MTRQERIISGGREGSNILGGKNRGERGKKRWEDEISNGDERDSGAGCLRAGSRSPDGYTVN